MDYSVINAAIDDIVYIVNDYNKTRGYSVSLCERLVIALLGYYIVFGPSIFEKINIILESLEIYECNSEDDCCELKSTLVGSVNSNSNPATSWDFKYDENKKFIGAIPRIIYTKRDIVCDSFNLIHELSHVIEGTSGKVIKEDEKHFKYKQSLCEVVVVKNNNSFFVNNIGIVELITIMIENKFFKEFLKLDVGMIDNCIVREFLQRINIYKNKNVLLDSYSITSTMFSDLINNDYFFELVKKYYYNGERELFALEYESYGDGLSFKVLVNCAEHLISGELYDVMYYTNILNKQIELFNKYSSYIPDKRILLFV